MDRSPARCARRAMERDRTPLGEMKGHCLPPARWLLPTTRTTPPGALIRARQRPSQRLIRHAMFPRGATDPIHDVPPQASAVRRL